MLGTGFFHSKNMQQMHKSKPKLIMRAFAYYAKVYHVLRQKSWSKNARKSWDLNNVNFSYFFHIIWWQTADCYCTNIYILPYRKMWSINHTITSETTTTNRIQCIHWWASTHSVFDNLMSINCMDHQMWGCNRSDLCEMKISHEVNKTRPRHRFNKIELKRLKLSP